LPAPEQHREPHAAGWVTRERVLAYATLAALAELALFAFCVAGSHGLIVPLEHQPSTDFVSFYAAGALANMGTPALVYDHVTHHAAEQATLGMQTVYNYFYYPPVWLLVCAPLARLPYLVAFIVFQTASAAGCFFALRMIRGDLHPALFLAFPGLWWAIGTGQNALLTAALFAAGTALLQRRPWLAGICFGALCYKPHLGLLVPVALFAGGYWRAVASAVCTVATLVAASVALLGVASWIAFINALATSGEVYGAHAIFMGGLTSPYGVLMTLGFARAIALAAQAVAIVACAGVVALVWRARVAFAVRAAVLLAATLIAVPVLMFYDLMLVLVALVWLSRVSTEQKAPWRVIATLAAFLLPLLSGNLATESHLMLAAVTAAIAFGLTLAVAWRAAMPARLSRRLFVTGAA
jgi:alpha-1,2-mannosyltransferase